MKPAAAILIGVFCATSPMQAQQASTKQLATDIDAMVRQVMAHNMTPGLAIAVVKNDATVLTRGYGMADIDGRIPVTENTAFYIASTTKAFTALTLALMEQQGTIDLDAPVSRYLTGAQWADGLDPDHITVRQLLSHTHGINNGGPIVLRTAYTGEHDNRLLKELLRHHGVYEKGQTFRYGNLGYNLAGIIIDDVTRGKWQDAIETQVLMPLGMKNTSAYVSRFDSARLAMPYAWEIAGPRRLHFAKNDTNMQAAGGLVSTAADLAKWLEVQINRGRLDGRQIFPRAVMEESQRLQAPISGSDDVGYSLGWRMAVFGADTVYHHGGGFSTFGTYIAFSPTAKIGVAVVVNGADGGFGSVDYLVDYVLERGGGIVQDSGVSYASFEKRTQERRGRLTQDRQRRAARPQTLPLPLSAYTGRFATPETGTMTWTLRDGRLWSRMGALVSVAEVFDAGTHKLRVELEPGGGEVVEFKFENGRAVAIVYDGRTYPRIE